MTEKSTTSGNVPFRLESLLGFRLQRLSSAVGSLAQQESQALAGLSLPEYRVLVVLHSLGASGVTALQQIMLIDKAWVSRTLSSLTEKKMVTSEPEPSDARRTVFKVTKEGRHAAQILIKHALERQKRIFKGFKPQEKQLLFEYLERVQANVTED